MHNIPTNMDDVIDSRDVIGRIEELEEIAVNWVVAWSIPGCLPDCEPATFTDWDDARDYLRESLERFADEDYESAPDRAAQFTSAIETLDELGEEGAEYSDIAGGLHFWITRGDGLPENPEEAKELQALRALAQEASAYAEDWEYGETLVRDSYFKEYAMEFADDIGAVNWEASWPNTCIDWDQAARELQIDYSAVEFDGVTYWIR